MLMLKTSSLCYGGGGGFFRCSNNNFLPFHLRMVVVVVLLLLLMMQLQPHPVVSAAARKPDARPVIINDEDDNKDNKRNSRKEEDYFYDNDYGYDDDEEGDDGDPVDDDEDSDFDDSDECGLYIANSTIPNSGLGIFTSIELNENDVLLNGYGDICIPIIEMNIHHPKTFNPFDNYVWAGEVMGMRMEVGGGTFDIDTMCSGLDAAINCHLPLINIQKSIPKYDNYDNLNRAYDPNAGAITAYHNGTSTTTTTIPIGGELFKHYGEQWFVSRPDIFATLPLTKNLQNIENHIIKRLKSHLDNNLIKLEYDSTIIQDLFEMVLLEVKYIWSNVQRIDSKTMKETTNLSLRNMNAMPSNLDEFLIAMNTSSINKIYQANATRAIDYLKSNGKCVDNIIPKQSTIEGAGRGAFAKRKLRKGSIITSSPLLHIPFKDKFLPMYNVLMKADEDDDDSAEDNDDDSKEDEGNNSIFYKGNRIVGKQLITNYCFGHKSTTMVLCPYGVGVNYINHRPSSSSSGGENANIKVVWSQHGSTSMDNDWLSKIPEEFVKEYSSHLAFDYIALRDIKAGEELFLDYGQDWNDAWNDYVDNWKMPHSWADAYLNAYEWNIKFDELPLRTIYESHYDPYPATMQIRCHTDLYTKAGNKAWKDNAHWNWTGTEYGYYCDILDRSRKTKKKDFTYTVSFLTEPKDRWDTKTKEITMTVSEVPREAIRFFDLPYTTDIHLRGAFRHLIGLPDELLPNAWKNSKMPPLSSLSTRKPPPPPSPPAPAPAPTVTCEAGDEECIASPPPTEDIIEDAMDDEWVNATIKKITKLLNCTDLWEKPQHIYSQKQWTDMRFVYAETVGTDKSTVGSPGLHYNGFSQPYYVDRGDYGRGIYAAEDIPKGSLVWQNLRSAQFSDGDSYRKFLRIVSPQIACDVIQWAYVDDYKKINVDLDEGSFCNHHTEKTNIGFNKKLSRKEKTISSAASTTMQLFARKDIKQGEEMLCNYETFSSGDWSQFGLTEKRRRKRRRRTEVESTESTAAKTKHDEL